MSSNNDSKQIRIFDEVVALKPNHYPWTDKFIDAMHNGFWTVNEFSFKSDIQQFKVELTEQEREIIIRTLSAIGQIEVSVKMFWGRLGENLPHPSLVDLGYVMANIEVIHNQAYTRLLDVLGLNDVFEENLKLDWIQGRVKYLKKYTHKYYKDSKKQYLYALILFTLFVENVSLFSQFYIINWFARYKNVLKDTDQQVKYTRGEECVIEGSEVLTPTGWVDFRDISVGDDVIQYNPDGTFNVTKVLHKVDKPYEGDMIKFTRCGNTCIVTPEHDMVYFNKNNQFIKRKAKDLKIHKQLHVPIGGFFKNDGGVDELSFEDRLRIAIQADGWVLDSKKSIEDLNTNAYNTHAINIKKERKIERLKWILSNLNIPFSIAEKDDSFLFTLKYNKNFDYKDLTSWIDLKDKSINWCKAFIDEVYRWDGYEEKGHIGYCSIDKKNIDIVQTIAILAGYATNIYKGHESERNPNYNDCYKLSIMDKNLKPKSHSLVKEIITYSGRVYCVTVESGAIMTRYKDKTFIAGNCIHALVGVQLINTIREEYPELFDDELESKIIEEAGEAFKAESKIVDWMINGMDEKGLNADTLKEFIKSRINTSLDQIGFKKPFELDAELLKDTMWFDEELHGNNMADFFHTRPTEYAKKNQSFSEDDLF